jgi:3-hydroxyisobutyrate dehydrogenase
MTGKTLTARIGILGLGNMGLPMAQQLIGANYRVRGFDISKEAREKFAAAGGTVAEDAAGVADSDIIIALLPDSAAVRKAIDGLQASLRQGCIIIDMSSSDPVETRKLGVGLIGRGLHFIDAPVSGGVKRAANGTLTIMVGGDPETIERVMPVLETMGKSIFRTGELGSGHAMKALNNYVSAAGLVAAVEAIEIGRKFGLDPNLMADIFNVSTGRNNTTELKLKRFIISQTFAAGFPLRLMAKDVGIAESLAHAIGVAAPLAEACASLWKGRLKLWPFRPTIQRSANTSQLKDA